MQYTPGIWIIRRSHSDCGPSFGFSKRRRQLNLLTFVNAGGVRIVAVCNHKISLTTDESSKIRTAGGINNFVAGREIMNFAEVNRRLIVLYINGTKQSGRGRPIRHVLAGTKAVPGDCDRVGRFVDPGAIECSLVLGELRIGCRITQLDRTFIDDFHDVIAIGN